MKATAEQYSRALNLLEKDKFRDAMTILQPLAEIDYEHSKINYEYAKIRDQGKLADLGPLQWLVEDRKSPNAAYY